MSNITEEEILNLLLKELPKEFSAIKTAKQNHDLPELLKLIHKLHGAVCYCNLPDLRKTLAALESALKKNMMEIETLFVEFENQIDGLLG